MKNLIILAVLSVMLTSCAERDEQGYASKKEQANDNMGRNIGDRNSKPLAAGDQADTEYDKEITQRIRQAIMSDESLSPNARTIKISTSNGVVTLRGHVLNPKEREAIARKLNNIRGINRIENQLEIERGN